MSFRPRLLGTLLVAVVVCGSPAVSTAQAQDPTENAKTLYFGAGTCKRCHVEKRQTFPGDDQIALMKEFDIWSSKDRHNNSLRRLKEDHKARCDAMDAILQWKDKSGKPVKVTEDARCLSCHAIDVPPEQKAGNNASNTFDPNEGVTCTACHGAVERGPNIKNWVTAHIAGAQDETSWRTLSMKDKTATGFVNLRDPVVRSKVCLSCHVGNAAENKVITHEMYAAGHPPLPSIEVATFSEQEPRHYRLGREQNNDVARKYVGYEAGELEETKLALIAAVMNLRENMSLTASLVDKSSDYDKDAKSWPEIARFDCAACHHELKRPSWRQERGYQVSPGRILPPLWPEALVSAAVAVTTSSPEEFKKVAEEYKGLVTKLYEAYDARQFGDPAKIKSAAGALVAWSDGVLAKATKLKYDEVTTRKILEALVTTALSGQLDYDAARQVAWAFRKIYREYNEVVPAAKKTIKVSPLDKLKIDPLVNKLSSSLSLDVRTDKNGRATGIIENLAERMRSMNDYDPATFQTTFEELGTKLKLIPKK